MNEIDNLKLENAKLVSELEIIRQQLSDYRVALYTIKHEGLITNRVPIITRVLKKWGDSLG